MRPRFPLVVLALFLAACEGGQGSGGVDASTCEAEECGGTCCAAGQICSLADGACCTPLSCNGRECGDDGCGSPCGICGTGTMCAPATWTCEACSAEEAASFCARMAGEGKVCGLIEGFDACSGVARSVNCGGCPDGKACGPDHACGGACVHETGPAFCARLQKNCGPVAALDNCGAQATYNCGQCADSDCIENVCACQAESKDSFCARMALAGMVCGIIHAPDTCGLDRTEDCGSLACTAGTTCIAATHQCGVCAAETAEAFCARMALAGMVCGVVAGNDPCTGASRSEDCGADACAYPQTCVQNACITPGAPTNDSCANAEPMAPGGLPDLFTAQGTTSLSVSDYAGSCGLTSDLGGDVVYSFTIPGSVPRSVVATAASAGAAVPLVYLRSTCADPATEIECGIGYPKASAKSNSLPPGTYYVIVDTVAPGDEGAFSLAVTLGTPVPPPPNDTCASAQWLGELSDSAHWSFNPAESTHTAVLSASTTGGTDDASGGCAVYGLPHDGEDLVYRLTIPPGAPRSVRAMVIGDPLGGLKPAIYLRSSCPSSSQTDELGCEGSDPTDQTATIALGKVQPGDYFLIVDGQSGTDGAFQLQVVVGPAVDVPDACGAAKAIDLSSLGASGNGTVTLQADSSWGKDDSQSIGICFTGMGPDYVYSLTTAAEKSLVVTMSTNGAFNPVVYLLKGPCGTTDWADELACGASYLGNDATFEVRHLPAGTYHLWADSESSFGGAFTLSLTFADPPPPPPNDACGPANANVVALQPNVPLQGETSFAANDYGDLLSASPTCVNQVWGEAPGSEVVYSYTPAADGLFSVTVSPTTPWDPMIWMTVGSCGGDGTSCAAAVDNTFNPTPETLEVSGNANTTYYLYVDSWNPGSGGPFQIQVQ